MTKKISLPIIFIFACLFILTVGQLTPFEIRLNGLSLAVYGTIFIGLPIVLYRQTKYFYPKLKSELSKAFLTVGVILLFGLGTIYVPFFCFAKFMCGDITDKTLFTKQDIFNSKIIVRHYDCGAYDSSTPIEETVTIRNVFGLFNFVTKSDTTSIDKAKWQRIIER